MQPDQFGHIPAISKPISRLVQGAVFFKIESLAENIVLLDALFEAGCTTFDSAHVYANGGSERVLGKWLEKRGVRDEVVIITKCAHPNQDRRRVTEYDIAADLHDSLARLQTDYIDLYLLHRDDPAVPVGLIVKAMNNHLQAGRIHAYGASNWTIDRIREANQYAAEHELTGMCASSVQFSVAEAVKEPWPGCLSISGEGGRVSRQWYAEQDMPLFTWSSLAGGFLTGRFSPDNLDSFTDYFDKICVQAYCYPQNFEKLTRAKQMAAEKNLSLPQLGLAYVFSNDLNVYALIGSRTVDEYIDNLAGLNCRLTPAEITWLESGMVES